MAVKIITVAEGSPRKAVIAFLTYIRKLAGQNHDISRRSTSTHTVKNGRQARSELRECPGLQASRARQSLSVVGSSGPGPTATLPPRAKPPVQPHDSAHLLPGHSRASRSTSAARVGVPAADLLLPPLAEGNASRRSSGGSATAHLPRRRRSSSAFVNLTKS